jgi:IS5 family transposase
MSGERFKKVGKGSFFDSLVYEEVVPRDHFLVRLNELIRWEALQPLFLAAYRGRARQGKPPYDPIVILKVLVLSILYNLSERQTAEWVRYYLPAKEFVGLGANEKGPDHTTLSLFKRRMLQAGVWGAFEAACAEILRQAREAGIELGQVQVVDSVHTEADVDRDADRQRQKEGKPPRDKDAQLVYKGRRRQTQADGSVVSKPAQYLGYKTHVSLNAETGLITSLVPTAGSAADNKQFAALLARDEAQGVGATVYTGDQAYDDTAIHYLLRQTGKGSALRLHAYRMQKKDAHKEPWLRIQASPAYAQGLAERYKIERKFGEAKRWHGFGRCRYLGLLRYGIQAFLTVLALNLKRIVYLLTGTPFRAPKRRGAVAV